MSRGVSVEALNRLFAAHHRSLAAYLVYAAPWSDVAESQAAATLRHIVADQKSLAARIAELILDYHGNIDSGEFPLAYTGLHDCSLEYAVGKVADNERQIIAVAQAGAAALAHDPRARSLAEEALGTARGHLENLQELARHPQPSQA